LGLTFLVSPVWLQRLLLLYELQGFLFCLAVEYFDEIVAGWQFCYMEHFRIAVDGPVYYRLAGHITNDQLIACFPLWA
jgi:hypothetical protein